SPRETEARTVQEYLTNRARYQLTPQGELVHRHIEELLTYTDGAREVSSEMLPSILKGLQDLSHAVDQGLAAADPRELAAQITTLFAQFEVLVSSTRQFYSYLNQVLTRFDLGRDEFVLFKSALIGYLQLFVDEIARHMPQVADHIVTLMPQVETLCARAGVDQRLIGLDGEKARRAPGLQVGDWASLHAWFVGSPSRRSDADNVRRLATEAMRSLLTNLRRISVGADRRQSRYSDQVMLARWFGAADDSTAHRLWEAAFGLYPARHLAFRADPEGDPVPATRSWWSSAAAEVPVSLRTHGERHSGGRSGARVDYSAAKTARIAERSAQQQRREAALRQLAGYAGDLSDIRLDDEARAVFLDLYAQALTGHGRPLAENAAAVSSARVDGTELQMSVAAAADHSVSVRSPSGVLTLLGVVVHLAITSAETENDTDETRWEARHA
ncbi:MAG: TIGR02677 family protein, partial [Micrococcales bacterium]|nr:TIGR02677 family protein [Micrococcales bacterium]